MRELVNDGLLLLELLSQAPHEVLSAIYFLAEGFLNFPLALCGNPPICVKPDFLPHSNPYTTLIFVRDSFQQLLRGYISGKWEVGNTEQKADG
ncbi:hypothetical protein MICAF_1030003 [Microcystis aeruginosa PCC 9807]|uniref:Uncharacterized protein n=1 Tax=Microcystis aeruginosa PCC 9807 TaxID=1160283 RepID=I4GYI8_MICAE|nr:hypothetical protein [Microcystis aeruginosa LL13-03]NCR44356.1 hypothetical protein [Microcystis aeruginosa SX13-01]NCR66507.1 hypothetical protein [Microcystis aeruginosa LL11-07]NCS21291.1 hypothetical protein [Microcystis aeruginosa G11-06]NCS34155.1 hypothetical protein [Microcystis aeruginosa G11-01]NCT44793.1 hypothetical protein [Microcystis aeruginosa G11-09]NCT62902.1 hypothetical protein [Microcystis aeruginosa G13-01]TRT83845.1 MAG: hypothetical protein EWV82_09330 [Microcysti